MPELPEVETVRLGLAPAMEGHTITSVDLFRRNLRFPFPEKFKQSVQDTKILKVSRRAKYIIVTLNSNKTIIMHLGMSGSFRIVPPEEHQCSEYGKHDHLVFEMDDGTTVIYNDPRRFGFIDLWSSNDIENYPRLSNIGPEPLTNAFCTETLTANLASKKTPIKSALLDQKVVAGLGNIYVCEALFLAGISPLRLAKKISKRRMPVLVKAINNTIQAAINSGGSTLRNFSHADGTLGYFQHRFQVYDKEGQPCVKCSSSISRIVQAGRSTFYCKKCQH